MNHVCLKLNQNDIYFLFHKEKFVSCSIQQPKDQNGIAIQAENISLSNLANDKVQDIIVLFTRKRGEFFHLDKDNHLAVFSGWNLKKRYQWSRVEKQQRIQQVVSGAIQALQKALPQDLVKANETDALKKVLKASFFRDLRGPIGGLSKKTFDRSAIERGGSLEKLLASDSFFVAEQALKDKILSSQAKSPQERKKDIALVFYKFCYQESLFAHQLGLHFQRMGAGSGGACKGMARSGRTLVIRKAGDEGPYGVNNPSIMSRIKRLILSPRACLVGNSEPRAERSSYQLSQVLGLDNVPPTYVENARGRECSVQLFVSEAQALGDALNISSVWHMVPRCLRGVLRSQLQFRKDIHERPDDPVPELQEGTKASCFSTALKGAGRLRTKILKKIFSPLPEMPQHLFEQAAISKYLSGDIDTHFGNMLSKNVPDHHEDFFAKQLDKGAVDKFVQGMYTKQSTHYQLLDSLLANEHGQMIVNHDGGAAFVHQHNREGGIDGYLSGRYRCLFEVLPVCSEAFSQDTKTQFVNNAQEQNKRMVKFILAQSLQELLARFEKDLPTFIEFWKVDYHRQLFKKWILGQGDHLQEICRSFAMIKFKDPKINRYAFASYESRVQDNLELIQGTCTTLMDRYRLLMHHLQKTPEVPMRDLFLLIDEEQIQEKMTQVGEDDFSKLLAQVATSQVSGCGDLQNSLHDLQNSYSAQVDLLYGS